MNNLVKVTRMFGTVPSERPKLETRLSSIVPPEAILEDTIDDLAAKVRHHQDEAAKWSQILHDANIRLHYHKTVGDTLQTALDGLRHHKDEG